MIWTDADREAFVRRGPRLWEAAPATKPSNVFRYMIGGDIWRLNNGPYEANLLRDADDDDLAAAFGLAVAELAKQGLMLNQDETGAVGVHVLGIESFTERGGLLVAAYRALYAVHGLEWEEVGDGE